MDGRTDGRTETGPSISMSLRNKVSESPSAPPFDSFPHPPVTDRLWGLLLPQGVGMGPADLRNQPPGTSVALAGCAEGREGFSGIVRGGVPGRDEVSGGESPEIT